MIMPLDKESSPSESSPVSPVSPSRPTKADRIRAQRQETAAPPAYSTSDSSTPVGGPSPGASTSAASSAPTSAPAPAPAPAATRTRSASSKSKTTKSKQGNSATRTLRMGLLGIFVTPVAILYGCGKLFEGFGKAVSVGPEKVLKAYWSSGKDQDDGASTSSK